MFGWEMVPFNSGGLGVACEGLSKALSASGVPLTFVLPHKLPIKMPWCKLVFANESDDIPKSELKNSYAAYNSHTSFVKTGKYGLPAYVSGSLIERVRAYANRAGAVARKNPHSVIHAHDWLTYPAGIAAKVASGKPLVVHVHATQFDQSGGDNVNREVYEIERAGMHAADMVVAVSGRTRNKVIEKYGVPPEKVKVVHNGVEFQKSNGVTPAVISRIIRESGGKIVLFAGRITLQKGPDYFVYMAKRILEHEPNTYFIVSGSGDMEGQMIKEVSRLGISGKNWPLYTEKPIYMLCLQFQSPLAYYLLNA
jgi:glycosyltransferase involved in cell wall biosynthesis